MAKSTHKMSVFWIITHQSWLAYSSNTEKSTFSIVEHSFDMWNIHMLLMVFELCVMEKKEEEERKKDNRIEIFKLFFQLLSGVAELLGHF